MPTVHTDPMSIHHKPTNLQPVDISHEVIPDSQSVVGHFDSIKVSPPPTSTVVIVTRSVFEAWIPRTGHVTCTVGSVTLGHWVEFNSDSTRDEEGGIPLLHSR